MCYKLKAPILLESPASEFGPVLSKMPSMPSPSMASSTTSLPRENSTIIHRVIVADPQEDIAREQARLEEAQPSSGGSRVASASAADDGARPNPKRQDFSKEKVSRKDYRMGDYILGQTLGQGEFGKVRMGWKKEGGVQVAVKIIRKEKVETQNRLTKIHREIAILRQLDHPNIVRLHEMVETTSTIGIILEYASGGELFDYILANRYLRDHAARPLFAQLISGVDYLHKKGIVHRDLKLENLLLDRNQNLIITDFGFANSFNPADELGLAIESKLNSRNFVTENKLDQVNSKGFRRGDLMSTSCGSPCYAAPELVNSEGVYTGRKVDVWSCGVILYAMLAGYLPYDDDPANPEGNNILQLYAYIEATPLVFPEYITPHSRDLLRRILVSDPRKRADLFEIARHSWLTEYAHVVQSITSGAGFVRTPAANETQPVLGRSSSVREAGKAHQPSATIGGLISKQGNINTADDSAKPKTSREAKRRTVQLEYVAPTSSTARGSATTATGYISGATTGPPPPAKDVYSAPASGAATPVHAGVYARSASNHSALNTTSQAQAPRPVSGISNRNSYAQPAAATVAAAVAQGRFSQPRPASAARQYVIPNPTPQSPPLTGQFSTESTQQPIQRITSATPSRPPSTHRLSGTFDRIFSRTTSRLSSDFREYRPTKTDRSHPPTSMRPFDASAGYSTSARPSMDTRRYSSTARTSIDEGNYVPSEKSRSRRFSWLSRSRAGSRAGSPRQSVDEARKEEPRVEAPTQESIGSQAMGPPRRYAPGQGHFDGTRARPQSYAATSSSSQTYGLPAQQRYMSGPNLYQAPQAATARTSREFSSRDAAVPRSAGRNYTQPIRGADKSDVDKRVAELQNTSKEDMLKGRNYYAMPGHKQSERPPNAARKVMDFFRRRGKART